MMFLFFQQVNALEIQPYIGALKYTHFDGCCQSSPSRVGTGVLIRDKFFQDSEWDLIGYSDRKWSEVSILKPFYFMGEPFQIDPSADSSIQVRRLNRWIGIVSVGGGYFVHSTRTIQFDLPSLVSGLSLTSHAQIRYTINDQWAVASALHFGIGAAADERGYLSGFFLGFNYRP